MDDVKLITPVLSGFDKAPLAVEEVVYSASSLPNSARKLSRATSRVVPKELERLGSIDTVTLSWKNLTVYSKRPKKGIRDAIRSSMRSSSTEILPARRILSDVTGIVSAGECMALMGASGAGKTTLLNTLNGRYRESKLKMKGTIAVNGCKIGQGITSISGYVQQTDLAIPTLTVREHLQFHAALRMDPTISRVDRLARVEQVIHELGLTKCADVQIGGCKRKGISGGEMKRLQFGSEVLTDPPLLFCDEPTTGLDSFMAGAVVGVMRDLAAKGTTIICTIHQPSSDVFLMFDKLLLLAEGRVAFIGPRAEAGNFFAEVGLHLPGDYNPADFFVHTLAITPGHEEQCRAKVAGICDEFEVSHLGARNYELVKNSTVDGVDIDLERRSKYKATWCEQFWAVLTRTSITMYREPMLFRVRMIQCLVIGLLLGLIFLQQKMTTQGVQNINGLLYMFIMQMTMGNAFAVMTTFTQELPIFLKDHDSGMYRTDVYYICKTLVDLPVFIILPFVMVTIAYWMAGLNTDWVAYLIACGVLALVANVAVSFGYVFSCAFNSTQMAIAVGMSVVMPLTLFGGLFMNLRNVPKWLSWIQYVSWFRYANEILLVNQWHSVDEIDCSTENTTCTTHGRNVLDRLNFTQDDYTFDFGILVAMIGIFRVLAFVALYLRSR